MILNRKISLFKKKEAVSPTDFAGYTGFLGKIRESFAGAWQRSIVVDENQVRAHSSVFACITLIAADVGKLRPKQMMREGKIWKEIISGDYDELLFRPNRYQTWQKFIESWVVSKLCYGNAYVYKVRNKTGEVVELHVLHPMRCKPLIAVSGDIYYRLDADNLATIRENEEVKAVPASEIIHDTMVCLYHPLVGVSPIHACGVAASQAMAIQENSTQFFRNMSRPSGMLTAPEEIHDSTAERLKKYWEQNFSGDNIGKIAVLGDGLKYEAMTITAADSQLIEQLKWTAENVCSCFHVPPWKIGVGQAPTYNNAEISNQVYYSDCLQSIIESVEAKLQIGLSIEKSKKVELDLDGLLRMDTAAKVDTLSKAVGAALMSPDEGREKLNLPPVKGGDTPYLQQQNYSLAALAERDADKPFAKPEPPPPALPAPEPDEDNEETDETEDEDGMDDEVDEKTASNLLLAFELASLKSVVSMKNRIQKGNYNE